MTRSAGDAVIPHSRPGRWRSAGSLVRTPERTGRPVRTACTGCAEVCAASGSPQAAEFRMVQNEWTKTEDDRYWRLISFNEKIAE